MDHEVFNKWCQQWDKAVKENLFADAPKQPVPSEHEVADFYGNWKPNKDSKLKDCDVEYWNKLHRLASGQDEELITEKNQFTLVDVDEPDGKTAAEITDDLGKLPNPVKPETREVDNRKKVSPNWAGGKDLQELHDIKVSLEKLESKLYAKEALAEDSKNIQKKLDALKKKFEEFSNAISPDFTTDYLS